MGFGLGFHPASRRLAVELLPDVEKLGPGSPGGVFLGVEQAAGGLDEAGIIRVFGELAFDRLAGERGVLVLAQ